MKSTYLRKGPTLSIIVFEIFGYLEEGVNITDIWLFGRFGLEKRCTFILCCRSNLFAQLLPPVWNDIVKREVLLYG